MESKSSRGHFFDDLTVGRVFAHAVPRTLSEGDRALYIALTGDRTPLFCSEPVARSLGLPAAPLPDLLVFHVVFGKSAPDISLNAIANLGYADVRFHRFVYPGDTLRVRSRVLGSRPTAAGDAGVVWVETTGLNQREEPVLSYVRWVLVNRRPGAIPIAGETVVPKLPALVPAEQLVAPADLRLDAVDATATGGRWFWEDYTPGERIDHIDGMTIEEAEHALATRLYQNTARVHFNQHQAAGTRHGRRLIYGGHVVSIARALAFNGLENGLCALAWNGGTHANPTFAGDTLYAWSEVLDRAPLPGRTDAGALRLRLVAVKNADPTEEPVPLRVADPRTGRETYDPRVVLDLDWWLLLPRRP